MNQREVTDKENITWTCIQAFAGTESKLAEKATQLIENNGKLPVVCTPSGGAQTVRLELDIQWKDQLSDEELLKSISAQQAKK
jgi:molybdopterin-biosynthesis enzyme MoeA-like protein